MKRGVFGAVSCLAGVLLAGAVLTGCLPGSDPEPKNISGAPKQVADVIARLELVTRRQQFGELCNDLFTRSARLRAGGADCVQLLRATAKDVRHARIRLLEVKVQGERASARVRTVAEDQAAVEETIELQRERGRYRIAALRG
ncbi:MAG: hypothetical protein ACR2FZ_00200 [Thermoleophilaceae bacterium]